MNVRKIALAVVSAPLAIIMIGFDVLKAPLVLAVFVPMFLFFALIDFLKGEKKSIFCEACTTMFLLGTTIYLATIWDFNIADYLFREKHA